MKQFLIEIHLCTFNTNKINTWSLTCVKVLTSCVRNYLTKKGTRHFHCTA